MIIYVIPCQSDPVFRLLLLFINLSHMGQNSVDRDIERLGRWRGGDRWRNKFIEAKRGCKKADRTL